MLDLSKDVMLSAFAQVVSMAGTRVALEQLGRKELQGFPFVPRPCFPLRMIMEEVNICHFVRIGIRSGVCEQSH